MPEAKPKIRIIRTVLFLLAAIFIIEWAIMLIFHCFGLSGKTKLIHHFLGSAVLTLLMSPLLYWLVFRPFIKEIYRQKSMAEAASFAKSEFIANVSHELRTPLNSIIGFSEILEQEISGKLNEKQKAYAKNICTSGKHLLGLINDVLELSYLDIGRLELSYSKFLLKELLLECLGLVKENAFKRNIKLDFDIKAEADIEIETDKEKLKKIIYHLLTNAIKFTPDAGQVKLEAAQDDETEAIKISIEDTGIGIKRKDMSKLYKEFSQIEKPAGKKYAGVGIGLSITKKLVNLLKGKIYAESAYGKGRKFTVLIPRRKDGGGLKR